MTTIQEPKPSVRQAVEQERAAYAWTCIADVQQRPSKPQQEYRSLVRGFGAMIQANGLGPALAFLYAKRGSSKAHESLLKHLTDWLVGRLPAMKDTQATGNTSLQWIGKLDLNTYRRARTEALAILLWLQRFAEGALEDPKKTDKTGEPE